MSGNPDRRRAVCLRLWCGTSALVLSIVLCIQAGMRNNAAEMEALRNSFIGTWATDGGVILQLRSDGSARVRYPKSPSEPVFFFGWEVANGRLLLANSPRKPRTIGAIVYGAFDPSRMAADDVDRFKVIRVTTDQADLISLSQEDGERKYPTQWIRTNDATLESLP